MHALKVSWAGFKLSRKFILLVARDRQFSVLLLKSLSDLLPIRSRLFSLQQLPANHSASNHQIWQVDVPTIGSSCLTKTTIIRACAQVSHLDISYIPI